MWAIEVTATLTGAAWTTHASGTSYANYNDPIYDDKGFGYIGRWCHANPSKQPYYHMIQLKAYETENTSRLVLPKYDGKIKSITLSVTSSSGTSAGQSTKEAKNTVVIAQGTEYTKTEVNNNTIITVNHNSEETKSFEMIFDFTTLGSDYDGENLYLCSTAGSIRIWEMVVVFEVTTTPATISTAEYATFVSPYATDFSTTGITVYTATAGATAVTLNEVASGKVPANTPVVLYKAGADGTAINVPVIASADAVGSNDLKVSTGTDVADMYVLASKGSGVGFYKWSGTSDLSAGKIYLQGASSAREFLGFGDVTGIESLTPSPSPKGEGSEYYNLAGQRVAQPTKGLYIVNGRKVVIK